MKRAEAIKLICSQVQAWTAMNGIYVGTLEEVCGSPWRGVVLINGVIEPACAWSVDRVRPRRGFRPGDRIKVGGLNISPTDEQGITYAEALRRQKEKFAGFLSGTTMREKDKWWLPPTIKALEILIEQEAERAGQPLTTDQKSNADSVTLQHQSSAA
jgi:hypothetical protein